MCGPNNHMDVLSNHNNVRVIILTDTSDHKECTHKPNNVLQAAG